MVTTAVFHVPRHFHTVRNSKQYENTKQILHLNDGIKNKAIRLPYYSAFAFHLHYHCVLGTPAFYGSLKMQIKIQSA